MNGNNIISQSTQSLAQDTTRNENETIADTTKEQELIIQTPQATRHEVITNEDTEVVNNEELEDLLMEHEARRQAKREEAELKQIITRF